MVQSIEFTLEMSVFVYVMLGLDDIYVLAQVNLNEATKLVLRSWFAVLLIIEVI